MTRFINPEEPVAPRRWAAVGLVRWSWLIYCSCSWYDRWLLQLTLTVPPEITLMWLHLVVARAACWALIWPPALQWGHSSAGIKTSPRSCVFWWEKPDEVGNLKGFFSLFIIDLPFVRRNNLTRAKNTIYSNNTNIWVDKLPTKAGASNSLSASWLASQGPFDGRLY